MGEYEGKGWILMWEGSIDIYKFKFDIGEVKCEVVNF